MLHHRARNVPATRAGAVPTLAPAALDSSTSLIVAQVLSRLHAPVHLLFHRPAGRLPQDPEGRQGVRGHSAVSLRRVPLHLPARHVHHPGQRLLNAQFSDGAPTVMGVGRGWCASPPTARARLLKSLQLWTHAYPLPPLPHPPLSSKWDVGSSSTMSGETEGFLYLPSIATLAAPPDCPGRGPPRSRNPPACCNPTLSSCFPSQRRRRF